MARAPKEPRHCDNCGAVVPEGSSSRYCAGTCQTAHSSNKTAHKPK